jgi:hypothetical protein
MAEPNSEERLEALQSEGVPGQADGKVTAVPEPPTVPEHQGRRKFGFSILAGLVLFGVNRGCSAVNASPSWMAGVFWFLFSIGLLVYGIWAWDHTANRHPVVRVGLSFLVMAGGSWITYRPIYDQYNRELPIKQVAAAPTPAPPAVAPPTILGPDFDSEGAS